MPELQKVIEQDRRELRLKWVVFLVILLVGTIARNIAW